MIKNNPIKAKLAKHETIFGILNSVPSAVLSEMFAYPGNDFVIFDTEHLLLCPETFEHAISAAESVNLCVFVSVPAACPVAIGRVLDAGAQGIVVSRVSSLQEAQIAVAASHYPPLGNRGISGGKNTGFGTLALSEYITQANQEMQQAIFNMAELCLQTEITFCAIPRLPEQRSMWRESDIHTFLAGEITDCCSKH